MIRMVGATLVLLSVALCGCTRIDYKATYADDSTVEVKYRRAELHVDRAQVDGFLDACVKIGGGK